MPIKSITRFISVAALFLALVFPLIVANSFFFPFITGKAFYFRALVELAFMSWVVLAFLDSKYRPKLNGLTVGVTVFALVTLVADLAGVNPIRSLWSNFERMEGWITIIHLWMLFMVITSLFGSDEEGKRMWRRWMNVELAVALLVAIYGLAQLTGSSQAVAHHLPGVAAWFGDNFPIHQGSTRIDASLGNAAYMAVYMLMNAGIAAYLFMESKARRVAVAAKKAGDKGLKIVGDAIKAFDLSVLEWVYAILTILFAFELYETATRGTILGLIGGIIVGLLVYAIFAGKKLDARGGQDVGRSRIVAGGIVAFVVILIIAFMAFRHRPFIENNPILGRIASISLSSSETTARLYIWQEALIGFTQRPILGWGQENFNYIFNANYNPAMWSQEQWFDRAHSVYLDWLTASGVVGLISYLSLYALFLIAVWRSSLSMAEKSVLTGLLAGYAVHNAFVFDNLASYALFFAMLGFAASLPRDAKSEPKLGSPQGRILAVPIFGGTREIGVEAAEYVIAPLAVIILVAGTYLFNFRPIQENTRLIAALESCSNPSPGSVPDPSLFESALSVGAYIGYQEIREQLLSCSGQVIPSQQTPDPTKQAFFTLASGEIRNQINATPKDARIYTLAGSFLDQIGAYSQAEPILEMAHALSPGKQSIDFELGDNYISLGKPDQAVEIFKQAYESATDYAEACTAYATALVIDGKDAEAHAIFGDDPAIFDRAGMAQAYAVAKDYAKAIAIYEELIGTTTDNADLELSLAQTQYAAGMISAAIGTLKTIEKAHPEYASQIDTAIKQAQAGI